jgi:hypothetical protein
MTDTWDGVERRKEPPEAKVVEAIRDLAPPKVAQQQLFVTIVIAASVVLTLQILILLSQYRLADNQRSAESDQQMFRKSVTCFLIEVSKGPVSADTLTRCGFLSIPGNGK